MSVYTAKSLPAIGYAYDALEPHIDAATMELHHSKHHQAYTDNMNKALATLSATEAFTSKASAATIDDLLRAIAREDAGKTEPLPWPTPQVRAAIRNHGGGFVNHAVYFANMSPTPAPFDPSSPFGKAVVEQFASLDAFKEQFTAAALGLFGSGWVFLALHPSTKRLQIVSTANQDIPEFASGLAGSGRCRHPCTRCVGACLLRQVPQRARQLRGCLVERCQLGRCRQPLQRRACQAV
ncbi:Iron/manganese superoxide dismutase, partial [Entophlyctis helioformis]